MRSNFVRGLKSEGGANISGLETGARNKLQEGTRKWGQVFETDKHKK